MGRYEPQIERNNLTVTRCRALMLSRIFLRAAEADAERQQGSS